MIKKILILLLTLIPFAGLGPVAADIAASTVNAETTADIYITYFPLVFKEEPIDYDRPLEYGLNFISSAEAPSNNDRYNKAISAGATWNRWPLYWQKVEKSDGVFNWSYADSVVAADLAKGFQTEIILMGTPSFYATGGRAD
ncbi:MAG: hypothetical protein JXA42_10645, partial [Anaerolineales bacterium]|nr:hypothetical protein [Anaerolineales bacterium]